MSLQKSNSKSHKSLQNFSPINQPKLPITTPASLLEFDALAEHKLFRDMPRHHLESLLAECPVQNIQKDEVLISPGKENHHLYLLLSGRLKVYLDTLDSPLGFSIEPGECIGEMSVIEERLTSAYVIAEETSRMLVLSQDIFWEKFVCLPEAVRNLLQILSQRMRRHNQVTLQTLEQQLRYEHLQKELEAAGKIQANGVTEAENAPQELFSVERMANVLTTPPRPDMKGLVNAVYTAILDFADDGVPQTDDITMLALRYRGDWSRRRRT